MLLLGDRYLGGSLLSDMKMCCKRKEMIMTHLTFDGLPREAPSEKNDPPKRNINLKIYSGLSAVISFSNNNYPKYQFSEPPKENQK